jgi:hypothetical protein
MGISVKRQFDMRAPASPSWQQAGRARATQMRFLEHRIRPLKKICANLAGRRDTDRRGTENWSNRRQAIRKPALGFAALRVSKVLDAVVCLPSQTRKRADRLTQHGWKWIAA